MPPGAAYEEVYTCLKAGLLVRDEDGSNAEKLLAWVFEAGHAKTEPRARLLSFQLLPAVVEHSHPFVLSASLEKLTQLLRSAMSTASPLSCRLLAIQTVEILLVKALGPGAGTALRQQCQQECLPRLAGSLLECCAPITSSSCVAPSAANSLADAHEDTPGLGLSGPVRGSPLPVTIAAFRALAIGAQNAGTSFKSFAGKLEAASYAALDSVWGRDPGLRGAAVACLAGLPSTFTDSGRWTAMLKALLSEAARTLKQVWPEAKVPSTLLSGPGGGRKGIDSSFPGTGSGGSVHKPGWAPLPARPGKGGAGALKKYAWAARARIQSSLEAATALLNHGHSPGTSPVLLPSSAILAMCEVLLALTPRGHSNLGTTPAALPPTAHHALQPTLLALGMDLLAAYLAAAKTSALGHLRGIARLVLRLLSGPATAPVRARLLALFTQVVLVMGASAAPLLVEPALPEMTRLAYEYLRASTPFVVEERAAASASVFSSPATGERTFGRDATALAGPQTKGKRQAEGMRAPSARDVEEVGTAMFRALESAVLGCGALLSMDRRMSIDKLVGAGLCDLNRGVPRAGAATTYFGAEGMSWLRRSGPLRAAFLNFATRTMLVPRQDGAGSALTPLASRVLNVLVLDRDEDVARAAVLGRTVAESIIHPRAAPLFIPPALLKFDEEECYTLPSGARSISGEHDPRSLRRQSGPEGEEASIAMTNVVSSLEEEKIAAVWSQQTVAATSLGAATSESQPKSSATVGSGADPLGTTKRASSSESSVASSHHDRKRSRSSTAAKIETPTLNSARSKRDKEKEAEEEEEDLPLIVEDGGPDDSEDDR